MVFDSFTGSEQWDRINFRFRKDLMSPYQIRSYINPNLATYDLLMSLAQLYAHKRSIAWVTGISPLLENSKPYFVRENYQIQNLKVTDLVGASDYGQGIVEDLNKDTLFLVFFKDHALTGEVYPHEEIEKWAITKKIIFILVSHEFIPEFKLNINSMGIQVITRDLSLVFLPERSKLNSAFGAHQNMKWQESWSEFFKFRSVNRPVNLQPQIQSWERSLTQEKWNYLGHRRWDRSLLIFKNIHSGIIVEKLKEKGFTNIKSFSDCALNSPQTIQKWILPEISPAILRGLIILSFNESKDIPSLSVIDDIVKSIEAESQWTF